ncbi:hypothetical protein QEH53_21740 [Pelagicoccus sp. SDUM812002]|nr:hypothetical protein [Pelagicoccus sp. SDUM812002]MDQ8188226.1 hypothetical protein [Pelagicoccus sp. SDUM812002]
MPVVGRVVVGFAAGIVEDVLEQLPIEKRCDQGVLRFERAGVLRQYFPVATADLIDVALRKCGGAVSLVDPY